MSKINTAPQPYCPSCGAIGIDQYAEVADYYFGSPGSWKISKCSAPCGTVWLNPAPLPSEIVKAYDNYHTHGDKRQRKSWQRRIRSLYEKLLNIRFGFLEVYRSLRQYRKSRRLMHLGALPHGRLLDVGCGSGRLLRRMKRLGWEVEGIDFDQEATANISRKYGIKTHVGDIRFLPFPAETFDAIVMNHAIEHVDDPVSVLQVCARLLRPGGQLVMITPNALSVAHRRFGKYWRGLEVPRHFQVFSRQGLKNCVEKAGLTPLVSATFSCDADVVYRVSEEMGCAQSGRPYDALRSTKRAKLSMLAEHRHLQQSPDCGEDILMIATKPCPGAERRSS